MTERKQAAGETPLHLRPVGQMINNTLVRFVGEIDFNPNNRKLNDLQASLCATLPRIATYDGVQTTASSIRNALSPYAQQHIEYGFNERFRDFVDDLEYVQLLERGGLESVNARLGELFGTLKSDGNKERRAEAKRDINRLLYRAIYVFPHLATGVQIKLAPGTDGKAQTFRQVYGSDSGKQRDHYEYLRSAYEEKFGQPFPETITTPLPYEYATGIDGSGERHARGISRSVIGIESISPHAEAVGVEIEKPRAQNELAHFTLDEVEEIKFVSEQAFTSQVYGRDIYRGLFDPLNPVTHYLTFRNFTRFSHVTGISKPPQVSDDTWTETRERLWIPREETKNLWDETQRTWRKSLLRKGFMASVDDASSDVTLLELTDTPLPHKDRNVAEALLFAQVYKRGPEALGIQTYSGMDAIAKLLTVPVAQRRL